MRRIIILTNNLDSKVEIVCEDMHDCCLMPVSLFKIGHPSPQYTQNNELHVPWITLQNSVAKTQILASAQKLQ